MATMLARAMGLTPIPPPPPTTPPPTLPTIDTVADILSGKVKVGERVILIGEAIERIDSDDYRFSDGTGVFRFDIQDGIPGLSQDIPLNTCGIFSGILDGSEVEVDAIVACSNFVLSGEN